MNQYQYQKFLYINLIQIPTKEARNNSINGDKVQVKLYNKEHWKNKTKKIILNEDSNDKNINQPKNDIMPTGYVINVINKDNRRPYVCSVDVFSITKKEYNIF